MKKIIKRIQIEKEHFLSLPRSSRKLLWSYWLFLSANPVLGVFTNAYLWRQAQDPLLLMIYSLGSYVSLPVGFYINGLLLRKINVKHLYLAGALLNGMGTFFVIFFPQVNLGIILLYGILHGLGASMFWGNKNVLSFRLTRGINRVYYNNIEYSVDLVINIFVPALIGLLFIWRVDNGMWSSDWLYKWLMVVAIILLLLVGLMLQKVEIKDVQPGKMWIKNPSKKWKLVRFWFFIHNLLVGVGSFIPSLLVLTLVGREGTLGLVESIAAGLSAAGLYVVGRKAKISNAFGLISFGTWLYILGSSLLWWKLSWLTALVYLGVSTLAGSIRWTSSYTVIMEVMDQEKGISEYGMVCDNELFFNIGRITGIGIFFGVMYFGSDALALSKVPLVIGLAQLIGLWPMKKLAKSVST